MKLSLKSMVLALSLVALGCGSGHDRTHPISQASRDAIANRSAVASPGSAAVLPQVELKKDSDGDSDRYGHEHDGERKLFGRAASRTDERRIVALVTRYYDAADAADGATACTLLYRGLAEAVPGDYGSPSAPPGLHDEECATVLAKLFRSFHSKVHAEATSLRVTVVRIEDNRAIARFEARDGSRHTIWLHRERGAWRVNMLLAGKATLLEG